MNRNNLLNLYDVINQIAAEHEAKGINRANWFVSPEEFEKIKSDKRNIIL